MAVLAKPSNPVSRLRYAFYLPASLFCSFWSQFSPFLRGSNNFKNVGRGPECGGNRLPKLFLIFNAIAPFALRLAPNRAQGKWGDRRELNPQPQDPQSCALTRLSYGHHNHSTCAQRNRVVIFDDDQIARHTARRVRHDLWRKLRSPRNRYFTIIELKSQ